MRWLSRLTLCVLLSACNKSSSDKPPADADTVTGDNVFGKAYGLLKQISDAIAPHRGDCPATVAAMKKVLDERERLAIAIRAYAQAHPGMKPTPAEEELMKPLIARFTADVGPCSQEQEVQAQLDRFAFKRQKPPPPPVQPPPDTATPPDPGKAPPAGTPP